jgi:hypothetical protein
MCSPSRDNNVDEDENDVPGGDENDVPGGDENDVPGGDENDVPVGECYAQQESCEDCRNRPVTDVGLIHFTNCLKPWTCQLMQKDVIYERCVEPFITCGSKLGQI